MIIVKLIGGLGNQLFQYAMGRSLSLRHQVCLKFDVTYYERDPLRKFELDNFNIPLTDGDLSMHLDGRSAFYREPHYHYDHNFEKLPPNAYVTGFWQTEKYFEAIRPRLLDELKIKSQLIAGLEAKAQEMRAQESVAVHVRRGDYLIEKYLDRFGVLPVAYYERAIQILLDKIIAPTFYFFSDDIAWVRQQFQVNHPCEFISNEITKNNIQDFYLMTQCRHHIVANSSFSWWAAWLNENPHKKVIAPEKWFNNAPRDTKDLIPKGWLKI